MNDSITIAVIMACYNRRETTLRCLSHLYQQTLLKNGHTLEVYLLDDGSTDQTSAVVQEKFPEVILLQGNGSLFWNGGMHKAFGEALKNKYDYYLWLNDDTFLYDDALEKMVKDHQSLKLRNLTKSIVIGSTIDPETGKFSYGGFQQVSRLSPLKLISVEPNGELQECTTMCGNCVLIPFEVTEVVGNLDGKFEHRWGDTDYGLRTRSKGGSVWISSDYVGVCKDNMLAEAWTNPSLSIGKRIKIFHSIKGYRKKDWFRYVRRHGGKLWPALWVKPYLDIFFSSSRHRLKSALQKL